MLLAEVIDEKDREAMQDFWTRNGIRCGNVSYGYNLLTALLYLDDPIDRAASKEIIKYYQLGLLEKEQKRILQRNLWVPERANKRVEKCKNCAYGQSLKEYDTPDCFNKLLTNIILPMYFEDCGNCCYCEDLDRDWIK